MPVLAPIRDMKNTSDFAKLVNDNGVVTVTKNGYSEFYCISKQKREVELEEIAKAKLLSRIMLAEEEIKNKNYDDYDTFSAKIKEEYGI